MNFLTFENETTANFKKCLKDSGFKQIVDNFKRKKEDFFNTRELLIDYVNDNLLQEVTTMIEIIKLDNDKNNSSSTDTITLLLQINHLACDIFIVLLYDNFIL